MYQNYRVDDAVVLVLDMICCLVDQDKNDQGTTDILEPAGFLVRDKFHGQKMFDFLF